MKTSKHLLVGLLAVSAFGAVPLAKAEPPAGYKLAWADEFDGSELDTTKWGDAYGSWMKTANGRDAITVAGGILTIPAYTEDGKHFNGIISTQGKFERSFGYYEARIKFQDSPGISSAFWLNAPNMGKPVGDPATAGMEIDIAEHRSVDGAGNSLANKIQNNLQWDGYGKDHKSKGQLTEDLGLAKGFHLYGVEWTEDGYRFFVDGKPTWTSPSPVSKRPEHILLHCLVSAGWAGKIPAGGYGSRETSKTKMQVDYVRYYESDEGSVPAPQVPSVANNAPDLPASIPSPLKMLSQEALNATDWTLAPLDQSVPGDIRRNLTALREDLLDEAKAKPAAGPEAYAIGRQLCDALIAVLDERDSTLVRFGYRAAQANANTRVTSQALEARRNYMMSWPQYAREQREAAEIFRQQTNNATLAKELPKVEWSKRTAVLRKTLDALYAKYRDAMRQGIK